MNTRKDVLLGADLPPVAVPVNLSQVYIRDQQWILGRPWEKLHADDEIPPAEKPVGPIWVKFEWFRRFWCQEWS